MARQKSPDGHGKFPGNFHLIKLGDQTLSYEGTQKFGRLDMCETIQWSSPAPPKKNQKSHPLSLRDVKLEGELSCYYPAWQTNSLRTGKIHHAFNAG